MAGNRSRSSSRSRSKSRSRGKKEELEEKIKVSTNEETETETENDNAIERVEEGEKDEGNSVEKADEDEVNDESEHDKDENDDDDEETKKPSTSPIGRSRILLGHRKKKNSNEKNALTRLIPGYTAPMKLDSSSLDKYKCGMRELGRRAERKDASTKDFVLEATAEKANNSMKKTKQGFLPKSYTAAYSHFKRGAKRAPDDTAGKGWFGMKPSAMTDDLKTDLAVIRNRTYLDPKRFYKSTDKHHKIVQMGTVIEGASEFYSSRLTKRERRANLTEELMADPKAADYAKNKFKKMAKEKAYQAELRKPNIKKRARKFY